MRAARITAAEQLAAKQLVAGAPELASPKIIRAVASGPQSSEEIIAAKVAGVLHAEASSQLLVVLVERAAWVRVYLADGTVIFELILEKGESYSPPEGVGQPLIWAGNSGSVYVRVGEALHGPLGNGTHAVRDVVLEADAITERFALVDDVPDVISQSIGIGSRPTLDGIAIQ